MTESEWEVLCDQLLKEKRKLQQKVKELLEEKIKETSYFREVFWELSSMLKNTRLVADRIEMLESSRPILERCFRNCENYVSFQYNKLKVQKVEKTKDELLDDFLKNPSFWDNKGQAYYNKEDVQKIIEKLTK